MQDPLSTPNGSPPWIGAVRTALRPEPRRAVPQKASPDHVPQWMKAEVERLTSSDDPLAWLAAVGLPPRLSVESTETATAGSLARLRRLDTDALDGLETRLAEEATRMREDFPTFLECRAHLGGVARDLAARKWIQQRNDLESAWFALHLVGRGASSRNPLAALDREVKPRLHELGDPSVWATECTAEVAWIEPDAFWGVV